MKKCYLLYIIVPTIILFYALLLPWVYRSFFILLFLFSFAVIDDFCSWLEHKRTKKR